VLKTAVDASSNERHTAYIFRSLELRGTTGDGSDFADTKDTEVAYLLAHGVRLARLHYSEDSLPTLTSGKLHVLLELPDHLGSSSIVVDRETGELVEKSSYQAYGNPDSDYRPARWSGFREDYRFTGKEEDVEVGVQYFGKRYLAASLGRWPVWVAAFALFRVMDIWKPAPVRQLERLPGGYGIVADDVMAGIYAALVLWAAGCFNLY